MDASTYTYLPYNACLCWVRHQCISLPLYTPPPARSISLSVPLLPLDASCQVPAWVSALCLTCLEVGPWVRGLLFSATEPACYSTAFWRLPAAT